MAMTDAEKIAYISTMVEESDATVLSTYLTVAGQAIINKAFPYDDTVSTVPARYDLLQCEVAAYLINKRGADYETAHSENGISRTYGTAGIPAEMLNTVTPHVGIIKGAVDADADS